MTLIEIKELLGNRYSGSNPSSSFKRHLSFSCNGVKLNIVLLNIRHRHNEKWVIINAFCILEKPVRRKEDYKCLEEAIETLNLDIQLLKRNGVKAI